MQSYINYEQYAPQMLLIRDNSETDTFMLLSCQSHAVLSITMSCAKLSVSCKNNHSMTFSIMQYGLILLTRYAPLKNISQCSSWEVLLT